MQIVQMGPLSASRGGRKGSRGPSCHATWNENLSHLRGLLESERPWMVLGTPFIQLLEYYFSTLPSVIYIFTYLKICGFSL